MEFDAGVEPNLLNLLSHFGPVSTNATIYFNIYFRCQLDQFYTSTLKINYYQHYLKCVAMYLTNLRITMQGNIKIRYDMKD